MIRRPRRGAIAALALVALAFATDRVGAICVGDCDGDGAVVISELVTGVRVATGVADVTACPDFDVNADDEVTIDELVRGVRAATAGCTPRGGIGQVDTTPPTVTSAVALGATTVRIAFSEPLLRTAEDAAAEDARNYSLTPSVSGLAAAVVTAARLNAAKTQVVLTTLPLVAGVEYRVAVTRVKDEAGNPLDTRNPVSFVFAGQPGGALPRVVGAASIGNTAVVVQFSVPMADNAVDPKSYRITQPNVNPEAGKLEVTAAEFSAAGNRLSVRLTTRSQNELTYALTALAVTDLAGTPIGPSITVGGKTIDPATATFPGTGPSCLPSACTNGGDGIDGAGACAADADCALYPPCSAGAEWRSFGLALDLESIDALVVDPSDPKTLYAAGKGAGIVFKSIDGGRTWSPNATELPGIVGLVIDPAAPVTLYAAGTKGVVASIDGGDTWTPANGNLPADDLTVATLVIDPWTPSTLYVGGTMRGGLSNQGVIFRSSDRGATWGNPIYPGSREKVSAIAFDPHDRVVIYAGDENGVRKTVNGGITWPQAILTNAAVTTIVVDPRAPATLYVGTENSGVFTSVNGAASWTQSTVLGAGTFVGALAIDRSDSHTLYAAGSCTATGCTNHRYKSTDGGSTWIPIDGGLPAALDPGFVAAIDGAVFTSPGAGLFAIVACPENACASRCELRDSDDGVADNEEQRGWVVVITQADGQTFEREVTSRTDRADSDADGLSDLEEEQLRTDPTAADTDADGIDDATEWNVLHSDPRAQDSDGDGLLDGTEVQFTRTSPILADTDGDGLSDGDELFAFNRNPLIADVPDVMITVGDVRLQIEETFSYTDEQGDTVSEETTTATTLSRDEHGTFVTSHENHDNNLDEFAAGVDFGWKTGTITKDSCDTFVAPKGACFGGRTVLANIERTQTDDFGDTLANSSESARESENAFETTADRVREHAASSSVTREVTGARIDVDLTIANTNDIAFTVRDLEVTVLQRNPLDTKGFIPVATLVSNKALVSGEPLAVTLGPLKKSAGPFLFTSRDVFATLVQELMRAPQGLVFKVANYDLTDEFGRSFTFTGQTVHDRTVEIIIDSGDMGAERAFAATSAAQDDGYLAGGGLLGGFGDKGRATGLPLDYVLQGILGLKKFRPTAIVAGADGTADSTVNADTDDVQVIAPGTTGLDFHSVVIDPGPNGTIDSPVAAGDEFRPTAIVAGADATADSTVKTGTDDVQAIAPGTTGLDFHSVVIDPGPNGTIDSPVAAGDEQEQSEPDGIVAGLNQTADSYAVGDDVQLIPPGTTGVSVGSIVIGAGVNGTIESTPLEDDKLEYVTGYETSRTCDQLSRNAFQPCRLDSECTASGQGGGFCALPERLVRVGSLRNGDFNRAWFVLGTGDLATAANFGDLRAHAGETLRLAFLQDLDHDGLFAQEEFLAGSLDSAVDRFDNSTFGVDFDLDEALKHVPPPGMPADGIPDSQDTDFDGLGDYAEVKVGWKVSTEAGLMQVFSSPRSRDTDGDGLLDPEEADLRNFCAMNDPRMDGLCAFQSNPVTQNEASAIVAGKNGKADTVIPKKDEPGYDKNNDDVPLVPSVVTNLSYDAPVIGPGPNGVIDTALGGDDQYTSARFIPPATDPSRRDTDDDGVTDGDELLGFDVGLAIIDGGNGIAESTKQGDDVARAQFEQPVMYREVVILPGFNGEIESTPERPGDDFIFAQLGPGNHYAFQINCGPNGILDTIGDLEVCPDGCFIENPIASGGMHAELHARCNVKNIGLAFAGLFSSDQPPASAHLKANNANDDMVRTAHPVVTDPLRRDTDSDTIADGVERDQGSDPTVPDGTDFRDADQDGMFDAEETDLGWDVSVDNGNPVHVKSSPYAADTDGDGLPDLIERYLRTNPNRADTDGDGITDFDEVADFPTYIRLSAPYPGIVINGSASARYGTDPRLSDTDGDGLTDYEEVTGYGFVNPAGVTTVVVTDPRRKDTDGDGLEDKAERDRMANGHAAPTDATNRDTDGDGKLDGAENDAGGDPLTPDRRVTVVFTELDAEKLIEDISHPEQDESIALGWWFLVTDPDGNDHLIGAASQSASGFNTNPTTLGAACNVLSLANETWYLNLPQSGTVSPTALRALSAANAGDTSILLTGGSSGAIAVGSTFTVPGSARTYAFTSEGIPNFAGIFTPPVIFTPPLDVAVIEGATVTVNNALQNSFTMRPGQSFTVHGLWADLFTIPTGQPNAGTVDPASMDLNCGKAPYFAPRTFRSTCYHNFAYRYDYADIADPALDVIRVDTTKLDATTTRINGGCEATMHFVIHID